jgi:hypothetical protein
MAETGVAAIVAAHWSELSLRRVAELKAVTANMGVLARLSRVFTEILTRRGVSEMRHPAAAEERRTADGTRVNVEARHLNHRLRVAHGVKAQAYTTRATAVVILVACRQLQISRSLSDGLIVVPACSEAQRQDRSNEYADVVLLHSIETEPDVVPLEPEDE